MNHRRLQVFFGTALILGGCNGLIESLESKRGPGGASADETGTASSTATSSGSGGSADDGTGGESGSVGTGGSDETSTTIGTGGSSNEGGAGGVGGSGTSGATGGGGRGGSTSTAGASGSGGSSIAKDGGSGTGGSGGSGGSPIGGAKQLCVDTINKYRATLGLPAYARWTEQEACADSQAESDSQTGTAHGAFGRCTEFAQNECPGWGGTPESMITGCLQAMWNEGPGSDFNTHGHYINMSSTKYTKVACGFYTTAAGKVWSVQDFR
ncbi:MAG TPA: CAP domain-containing protein [Polyangiaceae bacterium]